VKKGFRGTILLLFMYAGILSAQNSHHSGFFMSGSEISIDVTVDGKLSYTCSFEKGMSIYSLARVFKTDVRSIYTLNNMKEGTPVGEGRKIQIPLSGEQLITSMSFNPQKIPHLRVMYIVKPGETLFRISKVYFGQSVADVKARNSLKSDHLGTGDLLLMGWLPLISDHQIGQNVSAPPVPNESEIMKLKQFDVTATNASDLSDSASEPEMVHWVSDQAIALWDKSNKTTKSLYVLHNEAKIGSEMELFFPLVRTSIKAKVVGRIPEGTYSNDIALYVSPKVARQLGVIDPRFQVNIRFLK
jgi:hypothetical protein